MRPCGAGIACDLVEINTNPAAEPAGGSNLLPKGLNAMHPILGKVFGLQIYGYGTALALAFLVAVVLASFLGKKRGFSPDFIIDLAIVACIGGLLGARLLYILLNLREYLSYPLSLLSLREGFSFVGGVAGGVVAGIFFVRRKKQPVWVLADMAAVCVPLSYAIGRVGCLLRGCCYGVESHLPWALECGPGPILRHPTQVYASLGGLLLFGILFAQRNHKRFPGFLAAQFVLLYSVLRFIVEIFREGSPFLWGLHLTQVFTVFSAVTSAALIVFFERRRLKGATSFHEHRDHEDIQG